MSWAIDLFGPELVTKNGSQSTDQLVAGRKFVTVLFSAYWCPPCRTLTPLASMKYMSVLARSEWQVVFVSTDRDQDAFDTYFAEQPWPAVPFLDRPRKDLLSARYGVRGIPTVVRLDGATGELRDTNCRVSFHLASTGEDLLNRWTLHDRTQARNNNPCCIVS